MKKLIIFRGAPGCGKSTIINKYNLKDYTLSADELRLMCQAPITDENGECLLDGNDNPIFYDDTVWTYDPEYNISYKDIFTKEPLGYYQKFRGWGGKQHFYVTNDMIKDVKRFKEIFYIRGDINQICEEYKHDYLEEVDDATEVFYKPVSSQT